MSGIELERRRQMLDDLRFARREVVDSQAEASHTGWHGDRLRQCVVAVSAVIAVVGSFVGSGAAGGTPIQNAAGGALSSDATLIAPAGPAFAIWSVIYLGLVAYAVWQFLPRQTTSPRQRRVGYWIAASLVLNAAWILSVQFGMLPLSAAVIVVLLAVLARIFVLLRREKPAGWVEDIVLDGTAGLYLGWVSIATAANLTSFLMVAGFSGAGLPPTVWATAVLIVAGLVGVFLAVWGRGRFTPSAALSWGLVWVAVSRLGGALISIPVAGTAITTATIVVVVTIAVRVRAVARPPAGTMTGASA